MRVYNVRASGAARRRILTHASMNSPDGNKAEIGVLLVHGIGEQQPGETLLNVGEPIVAWIGQWLDDVGMAWSLGHDEIPERYRSLRSGRHRITEACILPAGDEPPHVAVELQTDPLRPDPADAASTRRSGWLIAESRWAASFPPPNPRQVIRWTMTVLPALVAAAIWSNELLFRWQRRRGEPRRPRGWQRAPVVAIGVAAVTVVLFVTAPIVLALDLLLAALLLFTFVPIPAIQRYLDWVQFKLAAIVGDSYIFVESPMRQRAVIERVLQDLAWLEQRCQYVTIVAHSQGAAVIYYALQEKLFSAAGRRADSTIRLLVTFGSGLAKLQALNMSRDPKYGHYAVLTFGGVPLVAVTILLLAYGAVPAAYVRPVIGGVVTAVLALMVLETVMLAPSGMAAGTFRWWAQELKQRGVHWIDVYASRDPIPAGPILRAGESDVPESREVHNRGSVFSDHTTYASNLDEFIPLIVTSIARHSPCSVPVHDLTPKDAAAIRSAAKLRQYRVKFLVFHRRVILLSMLAVLVNARLLPPLGIAFRTAVGELRGALLGGVLTTPFAAVPDFGVRDGAIGVVIAALCYAILLSLFTWSWNLVDAAAVTDLTWRRTYREMYIGRPVMLARTRRFEARFADFMLRLLPWLGASLAIVAVASTSRGWVGGWAPPSAVEAVGPVVLLTIVLALTDLAVSYTRRRRFLEEFVEEPAAAD